MDVSPPFATARRLVCPGIAVFIYPVLQLFRLLSRQQTYLESPTMNKSGKTCEFEFHTGSEITCFFSRLHHM